MANVEFSFEGSFDTLNKQLNSYEKNLKDIQGAADDMANAQAQAFGKAEKAQKGAIDATQGLEKELKKELGVIEKLEKEFQELGNKVKSAQDTSSIKKYREEQDKVLKQLKEINKETAPLASSGDELKKGFSGVGSFLGAQLNPLLAVGTAATAAVKTFELVSEISKEVREASGFASQLTGESGNSLKEITANARALANTFDQDYKEVLLAANAVSKEFGITQEEALANIEKGLISGANAQGDFIDNLKEYPAQFANAQGSAEQFVNTLISAQQEGIFSDKGVDAVKEFNLRIREQAQGTRDAIVNLLGEDQGNALLAGVADGSLTSIDALKQVSDGLDDTSVSADVLQTAVADVFGGAGEDAGLRYLQNLGETIDGQIVLSEEAQKFADIQQKRLDLNVQLAEAEAAVAEAFGGTGEGLEGFGKQLEIIGLEYLVGIIEAVKEIGAGFEDVYSVAEPLIDALITGFQAVTEFLGVSVGEALSLTDVISAVAFGPLNFVLKTLAQIADTFKLIGLVGFEVFTGVFDFVSVGVNNLVVDFKEALNQLIETANNIPGIDLDKFDVGSKENQKGIQEGLERVQALFGDYGKRSAERFGKEANKKLKDSPVELSDATEGSGSGESGTEEEKAQKKLNAQKKVDKESEALAKRQAARLEQLAELERISVAGDGSLDKERLEALEKLEISYEKRIEAAKGNNALLIEEEEAYQREKALIQAKFDAIATAEEETKNQEDFELARQRFDDLKQAAGDLGESLGQIAGFSGVGSLFENLSTFFGDEDIATQAEKTQAAIGAAAAGVDILGQAFSQYYAQQAQESAALVQSFDDQISKQEEVIQSQVDLAEEGKANSVESEQEKLDLLQEQRDKAIQDQEKAQKRQAIAESASQVSSLLTAGARLIADGALKGGIGIIAAGGFIASMLATFAGLKSKAKAASVVAREGYTEVLGGSLHTQGGNRLNHIEAERGEFVGIASRKATFSYGHDLKNIIDGANKGIHPIEYLRRLSAPIYSPEEVNQMYDHHVMRTIDVRPNNAGVESRLDRMLKYEKSKVQRTVSADRIIEKRGNTTTIIKKK